MLLGPTRDGRLYLSGRRVQRTRLRGLEIAQNNAPPQPALGTAIVADSLGELHVQVSSIRQRFLEAFRVRSEHAASWSSASTFAIAMKTAACLPWRIFARCSIFHRKPNDGTIERVARALRALSSSPEEDLLVLLKRALFAWLISDGDMHLKNMALLKIADRGDTAFRSVRFAPLYDAVTTRVFPRLEHDHLALTISGKDERLRRADFRTFASTAGLRVSNADAAIDETIERVKAAVETVALPRLSDLGPTVEEIVSSMLDLCRTKAASMQ